MFWYTDTEWAPWTVVRSNDKKRGRLEAIRWVLSQLDYAEKNVEVVGTPDPVIVGPPADIYETGENTGRVFPPCSPRRTVEVVVVLGDELADVLTAHSQPACHPRVCREVDQANRARNAATVLAAAFMSASSVAGASPPSVAPAPPPAGVRWEWADGSVAKERTFPSSKYANRMKQIAVRVQVRPANPATPSRSRCTSRASGRLHVRTKTSARTGRARLQINPICSSGNWCKGTFNLRLRVLRKGAQNPGLARAEGDVQPRQFLLPGGAPTQ